MNILKNILKIFLSIRTSIWLLLVLLFLLFYGAFVMPLKEEFLMLHTTPLFQWLLENPLAITWWLWGAIVIASLLTVNTLLCSIESVIKRRSARHWLLFIAPQIIHIGFLFILLAHLLSSYGSFKGTTFVFRGTMLQLPNGQDVVFDDITVDRDESGYITDWSAHIRYFRNVLSGRTRHLYQDSAAQAVPCCLDRSEQGARCNLGTDRWNLFLSWNDYPVDTKDQKGRTMIFY
jgi:hypothetical protein